MIVMSIVRYFRGLAELQNLFMGQQKGPVALDKTFMSYLGPKGRKGKDQGGLGRNEQGKKMETRWLKRVWSHINRL